jgi:hypothetical protein
MDERAPGRHGDAVNGDRIFELATKTVSRPMPASIDILDGSNHEARTDRNRESWRWWRAGLSGGVFRTTAEKHAGDLILLNMMTPLLLPTKSPSRIVPSESSRVSAIIVAPKKKTVTIVSEAALTLKIFVLLMVFVLRKVLF